MERDNMNAYQEITNQLTKELEKESARVRAATKAVLPGVYKHYKGDFYKVSGLGTYEETLETVVIYNPIHHDDGINFNEDSSKTWVRPISSWVEEVEVNGVKVPRFKYITKE